MTSEAPIEAPRPKEAEASQLPTNIKQLLDAAQATLTEDVKQDTTGATQLALTNLSEAIRSDNRTTVAAKLTAMRKSVDFIRLSENARKQIDEAHQATETAAEKAVRVTQETGESALNATYGNLPTVAKAGILAGIGTFAAFKIPRMIKNALTGTGEFIADRYEDTKDMGVKAIHAIGRMLRWIANTGMKVGVGALAAVGITRFLDRNKNHVPAPKTPEA